jgi:hypothetical protein
VEVECYVDSTVPTESADDGVERHRTHPPGQVILSQDGAGASENNPESSNSLGKAKPEKRDDKVNERNLSIFPAMEYHGLIMALKVELLVFSLRTYLPLLSRSRSDINLCS